MYVYINQHPYETQGTITYSQVVAHSQMRGHPSVTYSKGPGDSTGSIRLGQSVSTIEGMVFEVVNTGIGG